jgi:hypothetical protein
MPLALLLSSSLTGTLAAPVLEQKTALEDAARRHHINRNDIDKIQAMMQESNAHAHNEQAQIFLKQCRDREFGTQRAVDSTMLAYYGKCAELPLGKGPLEDGFAISKRIADEVKEKGTHSTKFQALWAGKGGPSKEKLR